MGVNNVYKFSGAPPRPRPRRQHAQQEQQQPARARAAQRACLALRVEGYAIDLYVFIVLSGVPECTDIGTYSNITGAHVYTIPPHSHSRTATLTHLILTGMGMIRCVRGHTFLEDSA